MSGLRVSILIITYNQTHLVRETVESCLAQAYDNLEIVVSDDGSTDGTPDALRELEAANPGRLRLVLNDVNRGITANCNAGLAACTGELIALMGGDDLLLPGKVQTQARAFEDDPVLALSYHPCRVERDGVLSDVVGDRPKDVLTSLVDVIGNFGAQLPGPATMARRSAIPPQGFRDEIETASDWMYFIDVAAAGSVARIDEVLGVYRQHGGNVGERYFSYTEDFLRTLDIAERTYGSMPGVTRAVARGGRRFLLGVVYRAMVVNRPRLARRYAAELRRFSSRPFAAAVSALTMVPGASIAFRALRDFLKRRV